MTLPNKITIARMASLPPILAMLYSRNPWIYFFGYVLAWIFCLTDFLDGYLARKLGQVSILGKILDPIADKLVVLLMGILFVDLQLLPAWVMVVLVLRELVVSDFRVYALRQGREVAVSRGGKWKATFQYFLMAILGWKKWVELSGGHQSTFGLWFVKFSYWTLLTGTVVLTVLSLIEYFWTNRAVLLAPKATPNLCESSQAS